MLDTQVLVDSPARHASVLPTPFACSWTMSGGDTAWVRLAGELDIATSPQLERTLSDAQRRAHLIVVDLREIAFADSTAIHLLLEANMRARRECRRLLILRGPPHVDRIFKLSWACDAIDVVDVDAVEPPWWHYSGSPPPASGIASTPTGRDDPATVQCERASLVRSVDSAGTAI